MLEIIVLPTQTEHEISRFKDTEGAPTILLQIFSLLGLLYGVPAFCFVVLHDGWWKFEPKPTFSNNAFC
jgi:hypothetical protein